MSYIGKSPAVGNFVKLDAITTSSTNTYNLTVDSVAFVPESANHMLVSLNGVIQAPLSSFSVSGSTITFLPASGTLTSSDSIDFIMVYGNVLDIGVPSDSTVTNAKTNFVSTSSNAGLQIKGDGTTDGTLQLNCSQNSHGIKLKSPPHSASASYTLTFPNNDGASGEALTTNGSGVLSWASAGETNTPYFLATLSGDQDIGYTGVWTKLSMNNEIYDSAGAYDTSNYRFTPQTAGKYWVHCQTQFEATANSDQTPDFRNGIFKNGSLAGVYAIIGSANFQQHTPFFGRILDMNGSSDYIECYAQANNTGSGSNRIAAGVASSSFGAYLIAT